jgi:hypothetical protein
MKGRIRVAGVGMLAVLTVGLLASSAGAAAPSGSYTLSGNGGFVSVSALGTVVGVGSGSAVDAGSNAPVDASGTGLCAQVLNSSNPCPTSATSPLPSGNIDVANTTQRASDSANGASGTPTPSSACYSVTLPLAGVNLACGTAAASKDASGNPTATGTGTLGQVSLSLSELLGTSSPLLCGSTSSSDPSVVSTVLTTVNSLLSTLNLNQLAPTSTNLLNTVCAVLQGLTAAIPGLSVLSTITGNSPLLVVCLGDSRSTVATSPDGTTETATATSNTVGVAVLPTVGTGSCSSGLSSFAALANVSVGDSSASITVDKTTSQVEEPTAPNVGLLSVSLGGGAAPLGLSLPNLSSLLSQLLGITGSLTGTTAPVTGTSQTLAADKHSGSETAGLLNLQIPGLLTVQLGNDTVAATATPATATTAATPGTTPAAATPAAAAPGVVPGVTSVHTGEFWAGTLPIILAAGMALAGVLLIARRRLLSLARSLMSSARHTASGSIGGPPPGPASGTSSVPPPVSGPARRQSST